MQISAINLLNAGKVIDGLCWMLFHSLWQGFILAFLAGIIVLLTRKSRPAIRYNLLASVFVLFIIATIVTFFREIAIGQAETPAVLVSQDNSLQAVSIVAKASPAISDLTAVINRFLNEHALIIVSTWWIILAIRGFRLLGGLYGIYQLKRRQIIIPEVYWTERLQQLATGLGIRRTVEFLESGIAKVPMVLGHLKPVILFPIGLLTSLPADEVEAILMHELAHIRRRDYLVNILQSIVEIFFFFNPGTLWVSSLIRQERENCCDDIAVRKTESKRKYIQALLSFQEFKPSGVQLSPAIVGRKYQLMTRVKRIIYNNNKTLSAMEKFFLGSGLVIASLLALDSVPYKKNDDSIKAFQIIDRPIELANLDTVPNPVTGKMNDNDFSNIQTMVDGKKYQIVLKEGKVKELTIDGQRIPDEKIADYDAVTSKIIREAKENYNREMVEAAKARQKAEIDREQVRKVKDNIREIEEKQAQEREIQERVIKERMVEIEKKEQEQGRISEKDRDNLVQLKKEIQEARESQDVLQQKQEALSRYLSDKNQRQNQEGRDRLFETKRDIDRDQRRQVERSDDLRVQAEIAREQAIQLRVQAEASERLAKKLEQEAQRNEKLRKQGEQYAQKLRNEMLDDLLREKIISDKKDVSISLNDEALIVNGVKQPDAIFQKFKAKYPKVRKDSPVKKL